MDPAVRSEGRDAVWGGAFFTEGAITLVVLLFAWLALDDITTDNASGFLPEYRLLTAAAGWGLFVACTLLATRSLALGLSSAAVIGLAAWVASDGLGHQRDGGWATFWPEYSVVLASWLWFLALSVVLLARGWRAPSRRPAASA